MKNFKSSELNVLWTNEILSICFSLAFMIKSYGELPMILIILFALLIIIFLLPQEITDVKNAEISISSLKLNL